MKSIRSEIQHIMRVTVIATIFTMTFVLAGSANAAVIGSNPTVLQAPTGTVVSPAIDLFVNPNPSFKPSSSSSFFFRPNPFFNANPFFFRPFNPFFGADLDDFGFGFGDDFGFGFGEREGIGEDD